MTVAPTINAIETTYKGTRFRSRTEARWAVFFDTLQVPWVYEPEGYRDGSTWYLPDFWLPDHDVFWEVKGTQDHDVDKVEMLARVTGRRVYIAFGPPAVAWDPLCGTCPVQTRDNMDSAIFVESWFGELDEVWMDNGRSLLAEARDAGLTVSADGDRLVIEGPRVAEPVAVRLLADKVAVLAAIHMTTKGWDYGGDSMYQWCECPKCHKVGVEFDARAARLCRCFSEDKGYNPHSPRLHRAYTASRTYRFWESRS